MRLVVSPHDLAIGGSQINAVDLAAEVASLGHDVLIYARPGPLEPYITDEKGLRLVLANDMRYRPAPTRVWQLARLARKEKVDVIHAYEWPPCLDAYYGAHLFGRVPVVCTVLSMGFTPLVPSTVPLLIGTHQMADELRQTFPGQVGVMEPPIDTVRDNPGNDGRSFRAEHGVGDDEFLVVSVSRLAIDLKLDALVDAIDAVATLARSHPVRLVMVGDGPAAGDLRRRADAVNAALGRFVIELPGATLDPRSAYAAADAVVGMGSSALRAMSHGKPVVVQGERGFARLYDEESAPLFGYTGFYGLGPGTSGGPLVVDALRTLIARPELRAKLGALGLRAVEERYSLRAAARQVCTVYEEAIRAPHRLLPALKETIRTGARAVGIEIDNHRPSTKLARRGKDAAQLDATASPFGTPPTGARS